MLPNIAIVVVEHRENRDGCFSTDVTGRSFEGIFPALELRIKRSSYSNVLEIGEINFLIAQLNILGWEFLLSAHILLPLAPDGQNIFAHHAARWARVAAVGNSLSRGATVSANNRMLRSASAPGIPA
jgi:hypothetical protein